MLGKKNKSDAGETDKLKFGTTTCDRQVICVLIACCCLQACCLVYIERKPTAKRT